MNEDDYDPQDDFAKSLDVAYKAIRERVANGGPQGFMAEPDAAVTALPVRNTTCE